MIHNIDLIKHHQELQKTANNDAYECTCHFLIKEKGVPQPFASGVFINIDENHFLFTAAHVAEENMDNIYIISNKNKLYRLGGDWIINKLEDGGDRTLDKFDVAILKLDEESVMNIKVNHKFIDKTEIGLNHKDKILPYYSVVGFPITSKGKYNRYKKTINSTPFIYTTYPFENDIYNELGYDKDINLIVHYDKNNVINYSNNQKQIGPVGNGISGCGLWYVPTQLVSENNVKKKLVGILIENSVDNKKYWVATRIDVFMEFLKLKYNIKI